MRTELPVERLHRRLAPTPAADPEDDDPGDPDDGDGGHEDQDLRSLLPRWLPEGAGADGWAARVRADPGRAGAIALAVIAAIAVLVTVFTVLRDRTAPVMSAKLPPVEMVSAPSRSAEPSAEPTRPVVVSVVGLVHTPGLVTLAPGSRIADALAAAGDALDGADTIGLNLARQVGDGEQIVVGIAARAGQPTALGSSVSTGAPVTGAPAAGTPERPAGTAERPAGTAERPAGTPVDLNTATAQQLDTLPGVGPVTAGAIVAWRDAHGKFTSVDQLGEVDGIGPARLAKLRALVRI